MAQENTAINELIHLATASKLASDPGERDSVEDLFWARNQANGRGPRKTAIGTPVPLPANPQGLFASDMDAAVQSSGVYSSALRPDARAMPRAAAAPGPVVAPANLNVEPAVPAAGSTMSPIPVGAPVPMSMAPAAPISSVTPISPVAPMTMLPMRMLDGASPTVADTPGSRHAARVAATRSALSSSAANGPAATAAARTAAARAMAANAIAAQGAGGHSTMRGVPSTAARAIAQQAAAHAGIAQPAAVQRGVRPIFHDDEDDEQTIRVDQFEQRRARMQGHLAYAQALPEPTVRVAPLTKLDGASARRAFIVELLQTMRRFAVPLAVLMVVAVFAGGYFAFDGQGGKPRRTSKSAPESASAPSAPGSAPSAPGSAPTPASESAPGSAPTPASESAPGSALASTSTSVLATSTTSGAASATFEPIETQDGKPAEPQLTVSAMLATKLAQAHMDESIALARGAVALEADEIEMDVLDVDADRAERADRTQRAERSERSEKSERSSRASRNGREAVRGMTKREAARGERAAKREARARADRDALDAALDAKRDSKRNEKRASADDDDVANDEVVAAKRKDKRDVKNGGKRDEAVGEGALPANVANKTAAAEGKLAVTSNVPAMIYVDGRATGMMTPKKFAVPAGPHKVTLLDPETKKAKTQDVEIVAGRTASIDKQF